MSGFVCMERLTQGPWQALERMLARLLEHSGFKDVMIVGGSGDQGADIVGSFKQQRWVVQAKYRRSGYLDSTAAKEAIKAMAVYKGDIAVVASNLTFNQDAYKYRQQLVLNGVDLRFWDGKFLMDYYRKLPDVSRNYNELRSYQVEAVDAVEHKRSIGGKSALIVMATGLGKSIVANQLIANELERNPIQEILVLAHVSDLVKQLEHTSWSQLRKQWTTHIWTDGEVPAYSGGIVFATWQSVLGSHKRRESLEERFGLIIVDEAHHAPSEQYSQLIRDLRSNFLVGMTATPWRGDEKSLCDIFGQPTYSKDIVDGMQQGFLAEVDYRMLTDGINWDEIALLSKQGYTIKDLNARLILPDRDVAIVDKIADHFSSMSNPRAIVFCRSQAHTEKLQPLFLSRGIKTAVLHSNMPREQRFINLSSFRAGLIDCLLSVDMLNEGIDVPDVNLVIFMRVTHSRRIFVQQLGRGLRIKPGKEKVVVLDFVADIRRIAAGLNINKEAAERGYKEEVIRFQDGRIVKFDNDEPALFFNEYLADIADIEDMEDGAKLRFPDEIF